jgi:hypothetical protein
MKKGVYIVNLLGIVRTVRLKVALQASTSYSFEGSQETLLEAAAHNTICFVDLTVGLGVRHKCIADLYP